MKRTRRFLRWLDEDVPVPRFFAYPMFAAAALSVIDLVLDVAR